MPTAAPRACTSLACRQMAVQGGRCADHQREAWIKKPKSTKRVTGRRLQAMRATLRQRDPLCATCKELGLVREWTQRDHIVPLAEGGTDDDANVQGLCDEHHEAKSLAEALRGRRRA